MIEDSPSAASVESRHSAVVVGGGPAGLMAAEALSQAGCSVALFDAMPTVGRKFLLAGIGGLNLTHSEPMEAFVARYGERATVCAQWLDVLGPQGVRDWAHQLGIQTFVGSSRRVFPTDMKAAPLLRAWLHRLRHPGQGLPVQFFMRHRWTGELTRGPQGEWALAFHGPAGKLKVQATVVVLALGGGSWARLGSDGAWVQPLQAWGVDVAPLRPANCGFDVVVFPPDQARTAPRTGWSAHLQQVCAGQPLKGVSLSFAPLEGRPGELHTRKGECVITQTGLEGSLIYAVSTELRRQIDTQGLARIWLNLRPDLTPERVRQEVAHPRGARSLSSHLQSRLKLTRVHTTLLHELLPPAVLNNPVALAQAIQHLPVCLGAPRPLDEAISTAGGVRIEALDEHLMLRDRPGIFCAGEMLDWEAPTGGYLLTACLASGRVAGQGAARWLGCHTAVTQAS